MPGDDIVTRHIKPFYLLSAALLVVLCFIPLFKGIIITDYKTGRLLYYHSAGADDRFSILYIHSVNKSPVEDVFLILKTGDIILEKTIFSSFGAGVPSSVNDGGQLQLYRDRIEVTGINRRIDRFLLFVGVTAEHMFRIKNNEILLRSIIHTQGNLWIRTGRVSLFNIFTLRH